MGGTFEFLGDIIAGELDIYVITAALIVTMVVLLFFSFPMVVPLVVATLIGLVHFSQSGCRAWRSHLRDGRG